MPVAAIRGAITLDINTRDEVLDRTRELMSTVLDENDLCGDDVVSILFTATPDVTAEFPAVAARALGLAHVPLICARELDVDGALPLCVRVLVQVETDRPRRSFSPVYLRDAALLRPDLLQD